MLVAISALVALAAQAEVAPPASADRQAILARISENALAWIDRLPDFLCTQTSRRSTDKSGTGKHFHRNETVVEEVGYTGGHEVYKVLTLNGKPTTRTHADVMRGYGSSGEFGSSLRAVFDPKVAAQFDWDRFDSVAGRRVGVYRFQVPESRSGWVAQVNRERHTLSYYGLIYADSETAAVLRIEFVTGAPSDWVLTRDAVDLQYGFVTIAGRQYVLPLRAEENSTYRGTLLKKEISFSGYRKYTADSSVKFEPDK